MRLTSEWYVYSQIMEGENMCASFFDLRDSQDIIVLRKIDNSTIVDCVHIRDLNNLVVSISEYSSLLEYIGAEGL